MSTGKGLDVVVRVPVRIVDDDGIGSGQIDSQTASPEDDAKQSTSSFIFVGKRSVLLLVIKQEWTQRHICENS